jgi:hypothetical protein
MSKPKASTAKPSRELSDEQLVARLPSALLARVDAFAERMRAELPGSRFARAEAVRVLLSRALDAAETEKKGRK